MFANLDKMFIWLLYGGLFTFATILVNDITTDGPVGRSISIALAAVFAYSTKPIIERFVRYQIFLMIVLLWCINVYLMTH